MVDLNSFFVENVVGVRTVWLTTSHQSLELLGAHIAMRMAWNLAQFVRRRNHSLLKRKKLLKHQKKEKALQKQLEKEKREKEKREQIMREALEAEREKQLEKERIRKEKEKKKERARLEKERRKRATEIRQKVVAEIAKELEREKQWQAEHEVDDNHDSENLSVTVESPQVIQGGEECLQNDSDEVEDSPEETECAAVEDSPEETECAAVEDSPEETKCAAVEDSPEGTKCALVDTETKCRVNTRAGNCNN